LPELSREKLSGPPLYKTTAASSPGGSGWWLVVDAGKGECLLSFSWGEVLLIKICAFFLFSSLVRGEGVDCFKARETFPTWEMGAAAAVLPLPPLVAVAAAAATAAAATAAAATQCAKVSDREVTSFRVGRALPCYKGGNYNKEASVVLFWRARPLEIDNSNARALPPLSSSPRSTRSPSCVATALTSSSAESESAKAHVGRSLPRSLCDTKGSVNNTFTRKRECNPTLLVQHPGRHITHEHKGKRNIFCIASYVLTAFLSSYSQKSDFKSFFKCSKSGIRM